MKIYYFCLMFNRGCLYACLHLCKVECWSLKLCLYATFSVCISEDQQIIIRSSHLVTYTSSTVLPHAWNLDKPHGKCVEDFFLTDLMCSPFSFERTMDPSKAHYTLSHGQVAHVDKSEPDINVTVATSRVPPEMTVQGQRSEKSFVW